MSTSGAAPAGGPPSGAAGGDLGGVYPAPSVVGLRGRGVSATAPTDTQGLIWNAGLGLWVPTGIAVPAASNLVTGPDAFGAAPVVGTGATFSRGDHNHGLPADPTPAFAAPTIALGAAAAAGAAGTIIRSDATIAAFDATAPVTQAFGDAAATGNAAVAARRNHTHGMPAAPVTSLNGGTGALAQTNGYGISGANSNPPVPAVALTRSLGVLGAAVNLTAADAVVFSTAALAIGTWEIDFDLWVYGGGGITAASPAILAYFTAGTATAAFSGPGVSSGSPTQHSFFTESGAGTYISMHLMGEAVVTVAGTISLHCWASTVTGWAPAIRETATGYRAVRVA